MTTGRLWTSLVIIFASLISAPGLARAQTPDPVATFQLPPLIVTAQKEPAGAQDLPVSLTTFTEQSLRNADARIVSDLFGFPRGDAVTR